MSHWQETNMAGAWPRHYMNIAKLYLHIDVFHHVFVRALNFRSWCTRVFYFQNANLNYTYWCVAKVLKTHLGTHSFYRCNYVRACTLLVRLQKSSAKLLKACLVNLIRYHVVKRANFIAAIVRKPLKNEGQIWTQDKIKWSCLVFWNVH